MVVVVVVCGGPHVISEQEQARLLTPSLAPSPIRCGLWRLSWGVRSLYRIENIFGEDGKAVKSLWMNASLTIIPEMFLYHLGPFPNVKCQTDNKNSGTRHKLSTKFVFLKQRICNLCLGLIILRTRQNLVMIFVCREQWISLCKWCQFQPSSAWNQNRFVFLWNRKNI